VTARRIPPGGFVISPPCVRAFYAPSGKKRL
jgi:hypothetical protein